MCILYICARSVLEYTGSGFIISKDCLMWDVKFELLFLALVTFSTYFFEAKAPVSKICANIFRCEKLFKIL